MEDRSGSDFGLGDFLMGKSILTGIERQLVLEYLIDGNAPVTLREISGESGEKVSSVSSVFPVALRSEQMKVLKQGIILLKNPSGNAVSFEGKNVRVQFYFNKLALFFDTKVQRVSSGLALVIPSVICKIEDKPSLQKTGFSVTLYYETSSKKGKTASHKTDITCDFEKDYPLFVRSDFMDVVNRFLSEKKEEEEESIEGRIHAPKLIYFDRERMIFAAKKNEMPFSSGAEYAVLVRFPLSGPIKERKVYLSCVIEDLYESFDRSCLCACAAISSIREEDARFLEDKVASASK